MQSQKSIEIQRLRRVILDDAESPIERLTAARRLLSRYGPTERNLPPIRKLIRLYEHDANADVAGRCLKLKTQLLKRLDLQQVASVPLDDDSPDQPQATAAAPIASQAITDLPLEKAPLDPWDSEPPLPTEEAFRLLEVERPYELHLSQLPKDLRPTATSSWVLKPGANAGALIEKALDERPRTIASLQRLYRHMALSFSRGGCVLTDGPLYSEIKRILTKANALPDLEVKESIFEKLERQYQENERKEKHQ